MSIRLYADHNVRFEVVAGLRGYGVDVLTAQDDEMEDAADPEVFERAISLGRVILTQDEDFLVLAAQRQAQSRSFPGVIYGHQLNMTIGQCIEHTALICLASDPQELVDVVKYVPIK